MKLFGAHPNERKLALFAGGELGPLSRWRIERHLESCASCKAEAAEYFHLSAELSELAELPALDWLALARNIQAAAVQADVGRAAPRLGRLWKIGAAPAAAAGLLLAVWAVRESRLPSTAPLGPQTETAAIADRTDAPAPHDASPAAAFNEWSRPDAQITVDGRLSLRSFDAASGAMTITEYYAP